MSITVVLNDVDYTIPSPGESNDWGAALNAFFQAIPGAIAAGGGGGGGTEYEHTSPTDETYPIATVEVPQGSIVQVKMTVVANVDQDGPTRGQPGGAFSGSSCNVSTWRNTSGTVEGLGTAEVLWNQAASPGSDWDAYADVVDNVLSMLVVNSSGTMLVDWQVTIETKVLAAAE